MTDRRPARPKRATREDWYAFPLRVPPEVEAAVREIAARDVMAPSLNTVFVQLIREALAARSARKR